VTPISVKKAPAVIRACLAPLGAPAEEALEAIETSLRDILGLEVSRMTALAEPAQAFDAGRRQYSSTLILKELVRHCPKEAIVLGVAEVDLFIPTLSFVFGQAQLDGCAAVLSLARLRQEFYQLPPNLGLLLARARKEAVHEMGHTLGLTHCLDAACPMSISTSVRQVDMKSELFCDTCRALLHEKTALDGGLLRTPNDEENRR
jgi:archaemetzincin